MWTPESRGIRTVKQQTDSHFQFLGHFQFPQVWLFPLSDGFVLPSWNKNDQPVIFSRLLHPRNWEKSKAFNRRLCKEISNHRFKVVFALLGILETPKVGRHFSHFSPGSSKPILIQSCKKGHLSNVLGEITKIQHDTMRQYSDNQGTPGHLYSRHGATHFEWWTGRCAMFKTFKTVIPQSWWISYT